MSDRFSYSKETQEEENPNEIINITSENLYEINNRKAGDGISVANTTDNNNIKRNVKLHEMGEQLEMAENRCNTLKTQLDEMKKIYNSVQEKTQESNRPAQKHIRRQSSSRVKNIIIASTAKLIRNGAKCIEDSSGDCKSEEQYALSSNRLTRQNSIAIGTDTTDEAVNTINNILNGITISVNRLSELHTSMEYDKRSRTSGLTNASQENAENAIEFDERATGVDMVKVVSKVRHHATVGLEKFPSKKGSSTNGNSNEKDKKLRKRSKSRSSTVPKNSINDIVLSNKVSSKCSKSSNVKTTAKQSQKRLKLANTEEVQLQPKSPSSTALRAKKSLKRLKQSARSRIPEVKAKPNRETNLVELYHNEAAKAGSDSEDSQHNQRLSTMGSVPPISVQCETTTGDQEQDQDRLSPIAENGFCEIQQHNNMDSNCKMIYNVYGQSANNCLSKSYQLPTIASKLKQVAKSYIHQFNFRTIPFCVATSTTPSHNIGVNIQQVMNILKTRQSMNGISPTLAHNIGIAADKLHASPYSEIVSSLSSKIVYGKSQCPLQQNINYQQMQEIAKEVSEEQYAENTTYMEHNNQSQNTENDISENTVWSADPTKSNCTCVNPSGIGFQQIAKRFRYSSSISTNRDMRRMPKSFTRAQQIALMNKNKTQNWVDDKQNANQIKEKDLKCVLTNLHDEFEGLNKRYELLSKRINTGELFGDKEALVELEQLEKHLSDKEEEIKTVMGLYKEVVALKGQVRELKQKASQASIYIQHQLQQQQQQQKPSQMFQQQVHTGQPNQYHQFGQQNTCGYQQGYYQAPFNRVCSRTRDKECKDPMAALHLTKLLKQIQTYQDFYRNGR